MTLTELLADMVRRLDDAHIPYMVTGSTASAYYGEPRATRDLDIVVDPTPEALAVLIDGLLADHMYVDRDAATSALREQTQFNVIGPDATKVDSSSARTARFPVRNSIDGDPRISSAPTPSSPAWKT